MAYTWTRDLDRERQAAQGFIEQATLVVSDDPTALTALASAMMQLGGDVAQAAAFADQALVLDPNHAWAWMRRGFGQVYLGNPEEGLVAFQRAERLSPLDPFAFNVHLGMGLAHFAAGRPQQALQLARQALSERPGLTWPHRDVAVYQAHQGDSVAAAASLARFLEKRPGVTLAGIGEGLRFMEPGLLTRYLQGLRLAGLQ